jgi:hypothetical protein
MIAERQLTYSMAGLTFIRSRIFVRIEPAMVFAKRWSRAVTHVIAVYSMTGLGEENKAVTFGKS